MSRLVVFGAGSVGRGFIGQIFSEAGWSVTFVDTDPALVSALATGSYRHATVSDDEVIETEVGRCTALDGRDVEAVAHAVAEADFVATSVGARNLRFIAPALARGIELRAERGAAPLDVLLAENLHGVDDVARGLVAEQLSDQGLLDRVGFLQSSIGRMIPVPSPERRAADPGWVAAEPYRELPFDVAACRGPVPDVPDLVGRRDVPFAFYADRKLYLHNLGHCLTAYLGELHGDQEIADAIRCPDVRWLVTAVMTASAHALALEYGQPIADLEANRDDLLRRFANRELHDPVSRVGRDPRRKLAEGDRFLGALDLAARHALASPVTVAVAVGTDRLLREVPAGERAGELARIRGHVLHHAGLAQLAVWESALEALSGEVEVATARLLELATG